MFVLLFYYEAETHLTQPETVEAISRLVFIFGHSLITGFVL